MRFFYLPSGIVCRWCTINQREIERPTVASSVMRCAHMVCVDAMVRGGVQHRALRRISSEEVMSVGELGGAGQLL